MADEILYESLDGVAVITINRPDQRNAINQGVRDGLFSAFDRFENSPDRVAILTGAGDKAFCAGMDLKEAAALGLGVPPQGFFPVLGENVRVAKPVIAAVNGVAFAGGWMFAQMCDLCVASQNATFGITEARVGRGMPWAAPLINMVPQRIMMELLLTGQPISAQRAFEVGFVNSVVPEGTALENALSMARLIAANAPLTVAAAKEMVYLSTESGTTASLKAARAIFDRVYRSEDAIEGPRAFREKRDPVWKGR